MIIPALINSIVFLILSGLHFYWALGGKIAFAEAIPKNSSGERVFNPSKFQSLLVGLGLLIFSWFYLVKIGFVPIDIPLKVLSITGWFIAAVFLLRAVGDFRYVGFFKKIKNTDFGRQDTRYYSPLCILLVGNAALVELISPNI